MSRTEYWNRGRQSVPWVTGASLVMDCSDLRDALENLGVTLPMESVLDVGCGTGRLAQLAKDYVGLDISIDAVRYADVKGHDVHLIHAPLDVVQHGWVDWVCCFSVFTHIDADERRAYLRAFREVTDDVIVDIIPGDGKGDIALWTTNPDEFLAQLDSTGWNVEGSYSRTSPDNVTHTYFRLRSKM